MTPDCGTARAGQNRSEFVDDHDIVVRRSPQTTRIEAATMVILTDYGLERAAPRRTVCKRLPSRSFSK
jgi:hypothetical protein